MKRFALVPLVLVALFVGCSEENPVTTPTTPSTLVLVASTSLECTTSVTMPKTLAMTYTSLKAITSSAFSVSVLDGASKVVPATEIAATIKPFTTAAVTGTAELMIVQTTTAKAGNYTVKVIATEGTNADTLDYKLNVKADAIIIDEGIKKMSASIYNAYGLGASGLDVATGKNIMGVVVGAVSQKDSIVGNIILKWGNIAYTKADSMICDFKTINSVGHASTLTPKLKSLNGTKFAAITSAEFDAVTKNVKKFKEMLSAKADATTETTLTYSKDAPYFVAKLGNNRGYALVNISSFSSDFSDVTTGSNNTGKVTIDYYYVSAANATK